jgi:hypothetical protein
MTSQRIVVLVALVLLIPITVALPLTTLASSHPTAYTTSAETTLTSTSVVLRTYFGSTQGTEVVPTPMNLPPRAIGFMAPEGKCSYYTLPVAVTSGTVLNLKMTSTNPANLYLLPTYIFQTTPNGCSLVGSAILSPSNFTAYTMHWTAPENGTFYILLIGPNTIIILNDQGSTKPVQQDATITYATSTETNFNDYSSTSTTTYTTTSADAHPLYLQPPTLSSLEIVGLLVTCLGIVLVTVLSRRRV